jgi:hypothetical protein
MPVGVQTDLWKVRVAIQDTDSSDPLLTDEEIGWFIADEDTVDEAAARAAEAISYKFARKVSFTADGTRVDHSERAKVYRELAKVLRETSSGAGNIHTVQTRMTDGYEPDGSITTVADRGGYGQDLREFPFL